MIINMLHRPRSARLAGIVALLAVLLGVAGTARADFGFQDVTLTFNDPVHDAVGATATQAGGHPDLTLQYHFNTYTDPVVGPAPDGDQRNLVVDLPRGFYGDPTAVPTCPRALVVVGAASSCPVDSQIGRLGLQGSPGPNGQFLTVPLYNMVPGPGEAAAFGSNVLGASINIVTTVLPDGRLRTTLRSINQGVGLFGVKLALWGIPADPSHDGARGSCANTDNDPDIDGDGFPDGDGDPTNDDQCPSGAGRRAFLTAPSDCETPLSTTIAASSWQGGADTATATSPAPIGCERLAIEHGLAAQPIDRRVDKPSGYDIDLAVKQSDAANGLATPPVRTVKVDLPEGVALSPAAADGLQGCSDAQLGVSSSADASCPEASKVGSVTITTPLLPDPLTGDVYLGQPTPDALFRLFIVAKAPGVLLKIPGTARPDGTTGQLHAVFDDLPPLPFSVFHMHLKGGSNATLANPQTCGRKVATSALAAWGGATSSATDAFDISADGHGAACPATAPFSPSYEAGTTNPQAGAFSPFTMTIRRQDGEQEISRIAASLPPGLLGILAGIPQCPEAQAAAGTCDESTRLGTTTVESGSGDRPLPLTGKVFLGGAYKGAPYSLAIVVRAVAGPFDLGTVVVRAPLNIDASGGKVSVSADPLPTILQGVPLRLRTINVTLDRANFMFNPTSCATMAVGATLTSVSGATATPSARFQALGCGDLPLKPAFRIRLSGGRKEMAKNGHPGITADLTQTPGQSALKKVSVPLPAGVSVDLKKSGIVCSAADAAARKCADTAIIGRASVKTPALPGELTGPVYFVENKANGKAGLPKLWLKLAGGGVPLDLFADTTFSGGRVISTFAGIPDAPIASFHLEIDGGAKGILQTARNQCPSSRTSKTVFEGQNGKVVRRTVKFGTDCAPRIAKTKATGSSVTFTVTGIGAGRLSVSGKGARRASKTIKSADVATITAKLSAATKRSLARNGRVRLRLAVVYKPASGKSTTLRKTVTIRKR